jgi:hypothetical protein
MTKAIIIVYSLCKANVFYVEISKWNRDRSARFNGELNLLLHILVATCCWLIAIQADTFHGSSGYFGIRILKVEQTQQIMKQSRGNYPWDQIQCRGCMSFASGILLPSLIK